MKIKNISNKIIGIGTVNLVPDAETVISDKIAATPAVKAFLKRGYIVEVAVAVASDEKPAEKPTKPATKASAKADAPVADTTATEKAE